MKKRFEFCLFASVALGGLQLEVLAMNQDDFPQRSLKQKKNSDDSIEEGENTSHKEEKIIKFLNELEHKNQLQAYEEGVQKGDVNSCYALANYYYFGRQFIENPEDVKTSYYKNGKERIYYKIGAIKATAEDYEKAFDLYKKAALQGHLAALWSLGECYELQKGVKENLTFAKSYYLEAANSHYPPAQRSLGLFYLDGLGGLAKSDDEAVRYFTQAASQGLQSAQVNLGMMHYLGRGGVEKNDIQALQYFRGAADQGFAVAQAKMGEMYKNGRGVNQDFSQAIKWFEKAAHQGYEPAQKSIQEILKTNPAAAKNANKQEINKSQAPKIAKTGKPHKNKAILGQQPVDIFLGRAWLAFQAKDYKEALEGFLKAAELGDISAFNSVGLMYDDGLGVEKNDFMAAKYYHEAAKRGHAKAQANLGRMYREGLGVPQNDFEAVKWYKLSAAQGFGPAESNLGTMYLWGRGVPQSDTKAVKYLRRAAQQGYAPAQTVLAQLYQTGRGVMQSEPESLKLKHKAERQGVDISSPGYSGIYLSAGVVQRDHEEVRKAADQGDIAAQVCMGRMYLEGLQGLKQNYAEALKYYHKAAERGDISAQLCIGMMHMNGQGVEKNKDEAIKWLKKAASQGDINAQSMVENLSKKNVKKEQSPVNPEQAEQWQPSDGDLIQASRFFMNLKQEMGKAPNANEMLVYIQKEMNVSSDHVKIMLEELGLAYFEQ